MRRLVRAFEQYPLAVSLAAGAIPAGLVPLILGVGASRALTTIGGDIPARALGALLILGGTGYLVSVVTRDSFLEAVGSGFTAAGYAIYAASLFLGLGWQGSIAGCTALGAAVGYTKRAFAVAALARRSHDRTP